eukprot:408004-Pyramimonas_sp.AAC.2
MQDAGETGLNALQRVRLAGRRPLRMVSRVPHTRGKRAECVEMVQSPQSSGKGLVRTTRDKRIYPERDPITTGTREYTRSGTQS